MSTSSRIRTRAKSCTAVMRERGHGRVNQAGLRGTPRSGRAPSYPSWKGIGHHGKVQKTTRSYTNPFSMWGLYRKKTLTRMKQVHRLEDLPKMPKVHYEARVNPGGFFVQTREGSLYTPWGSWLAIDAGGNPYPIAADEHARIYEFEAEAPDAVPQP